MSESTENTKKNLQEEYKAIGKLLGESLGEGIASGSKDAQNAMDKLGEGLLKSQESYLAEKERIEKEIEIAQEEKYRQEYEHRLRNARTYRQAETVRQNEILRLQKKANKEYIDELKEHLKAVEAQIEAEKGRITDAFEDIAKRAAGSLSAVEKSRESMAEKMQNYGGLFETQNVVFKNAGPNDTPIYYQDTILNLSKEREELETYAELLQEVQKLDVIPEGLFAEIRQLSVSDAIRYQEELLSMSHQERQDYINDWEAIKTLSEKTSGWAYAEDTKQILDGIEQELSAWYGTIPDGFLVEGKLSAESFGAGFLSKLQELQADIEGAVLSTLAFESYTPGEKAEKIGQVDGKNSVQSVTYVLNSAGETVAQQLQSARQHAAVIRLRGE